MSPAAPGLAPERDSPAPGEAAVLTLVSHHLCPYVQRAAIALAEKGVPFERRWVELADKPAWFVELSPLGKVPLLVVRPDPGAPPATIFESAAILEYLEETQPNPLHPPDPLERARHRAWMEVGSAVLNAIAKLYNAPDAGALDAQARAVAGMFDRLEAELAGRDPAWTGPHFAGEGFSLVDAVFGPVFRYFDVFEQAADLRLLDRHERVARWRAALARRPSVRGAIDEGYGERLAAFLRHKGTAIGARKGRGYAGMPPEERRAPGG